MSHSEEICFIDLKTQYARIEEDVQSAIHRVLEHGKFIMGPEVYELEEQLSAFTGAEYAVTCSSGTDALLMALMALGIGPGDAVFTTPFTFVATAEVISILGATPVFVDIDGDTFNMSADALSRKIEELMHKKGNRLKPKCIIPVNIFGLPCDYPAINRLAAENGLYVIEDAAQSFGAEAGDKKSGNFADVAAVSFFPAKPLGCYGDGGVILTNDESIYNLAKSIRVHGSGGHKYSNVRIGLNARMDTIQAAVLLEKLKIFEGELKVRRGIAGKYTEMLGPCNEVRTQTIPEGFLSAWAQFSVILDERDKVSNGLKNKGLPSAVYYPLPLHLQKAFSYLGYSKGDMPVAEETAAHILSLPMHPYLKDGQISSICDELLDVIR